MDLRSLTPLPGAFGALQPPLPAAEQQRQSHLLEATAADEAWSAVLASSHSIGTGRIVYGLVVKRWIDLAVSTVALLILAPLLALAAVVVRLDTAGSVVFRQTRIGRGGQPFVMYKFRTMVVDPDGELRLFRDNDGRFRHKIADDPRITRAGRWLRRTSIDELPQLLNVVRGEMSLVGPRPELPQIVHAYEPWQHRRHVVRPGITGWWQTRGRSECVMHEHTELDLYYVDHLSPELDAQIVAKTLKTVLSGIGAF